MATVDDIVRELVETTLRAEKFAQHLQNTSSRGSAPARGPRSIQNTILGLRKAAKDIETACLAYSGLCGLGMKPSVPSAPIMPIMPAVPTMNQITIQVPGCNTKQFENIMKRNFNLMNEGEPATAIEMKPQYSKPKEGRTCEHGRR